MVHELVLGAPAANVVALRHSMPIRSPRRAFYQAFSVEARIVVHSAEFCGGLYCDTARRRYVIRVCVSENP